VIGLSRIVESGILRIDIDLEGAVIIKSIVVILGLFLILSGFSDLASVVLFVRTIESIFGLIGTGILKIGVGVILILIVFVPDTLEDFIDLFKR